MQPSKLVSKQKPVTAAAAARAGWWLRALRLFNGKRRGQTPEKRGRERESDEATCIVRDGPKGKKEKKQRGKREGEGSSRRKKRC